MKEKIKKWLNVSDLECKTDKNLELIGGLSKCISTQNKTVNLLLNNNSDIEMIQNGCQEKVVVDTAFKRTFTFDEYKQINRSLTSASCKFLLVFFDLLNKNDNSIMIEGSYPNQAEISDYCNIGLSTLKKVVRELKEHDILRVEKHAHLSKTYLNPSWVSHIKIRRVVR